MTINSMTLKIAPSNLYTTQPRSHGASQVVGGGATRLRAEHWISLLAEDGKKLGNPGTVAPCPFHRGTCDCAERSSASDAISLNRRDVFILVTARDFCDCTLSRFTGTIDVPYTPISHPAQRRSFSIWPISSIHS